MRSFCVAPAPHPDAQIISLYHRDLGKENHDDVDVLLKCHQGFSVDYRE